MNTAKNTSRAVKSAAATTKKKSQSTDIVAKAASENRRISVCLPLEVKVSAKKKFILNLNQFRVAHFRTLTAAKNNYSVIVYQAAPKPAYKALKCEIEIVYYPKTKRRVDLSNTCSICDKFATDAFTKLGYWDDDDVSTIEKVTYRFGGVDRENPRFEYNINVLKIKQK